jgi:hypothetical protein
MKRHGRLVGSSGREEGVDTSPQEEEERGEGCYEL